MLVGVLVAVFVGVRRCLLGNSYQCDACSRLARDSNPVLELECREPFCRIDNQHGSSIGIGRFKHLCGANRESVFTRFHDARFERDGQCL